MRDIDVRKELHGKKLQKFKNDGVSRIIDELEVCQGEARIDVAVVNGKLHGYEIKSEKDTLERLPAQLEVYSKVFDRVTLVVGESHLDRAKALIPDWWGVMRAKESRGRVYLREMRPAKENPTVNSYALCQFLWKSEIQAIMKKYGLPFVKSKPRKELWAILAKSLEFQDLSEEVRAALKSRQAWRVGLSPQRSGGSSRRKPKWLDCPANILP